MGLRNNIRKILKEEITNLGKDFDIQIELDEFGMEVDIISDGEKVGNITLESDNEKSYTIIDAQIDETKRGKGLYAKALIEILNKMPQIQIISVFRSPEAENSWKKLLMNYLPSDIGFTKKNLRAEKTTMIKLFKKTPNNIDQY